MQYCSLQHRTFLSPPNTSTTEHCFHFGTFTSFFMELLAIALCSSPVAYWTPFDLGWGGGGRTSSSVISFCLFKLFMVFSRQKYQKGWPFPPPVDHILSELSSMTCPSWVALQGLAHNFTELCKPLHYDKAVIHEGGCLLFFLNKHLLLE